MLQKEVIYNNRELIKFLLFFTTPGIKVVVNLNMAWGEYDSMMYPGFYYPIVQRWTELMFKAEVEVLVRVGTMWFDCWVGYLVRTSPSI